MTGSSMQYMPPSGQQFDTHGSYNPANWTPLATPAPEPEPTYSARSSFSPSYFAGSTGDFFRAISGAPSAPWVPGISEPPSPLWSVGGDMDTMTLDGTATGAGLSIGSPAVSESMQANMSRAMILPDGSPDWGKWIIVAGVLVTLYLIGREMGRKGPTR